MLGLSVLLLLLAVGAGVLGFGGLAGTLTTVAVIAFYVFIALLIVSLIVHAFGDLGSRGGVVGVLVVLLVIGGVYMWSQHHGDVLNRDVRAVTADASEAFKKTNEKAKEVVGDVAHNAKKAIDDHKSSDAGQ
jgi:uncharacterized membrane protein YtjA (UPF0391 family)